MTKPEIYISIDIETDGPAPGINSMLALGAVAIKQGVEYSTFYRTMNRLSFAQQNADTMKWWETQPEAWKEVNSNCVDPKTAMLAFDKWLKSLEKDGKLIAVAWPAAFDFAFVNYYLHNFIGRNPLGFAAIDIRSYACGLTKTKGYYSLPEKQVNQLVGKINKKGLRPHVALDDAIEQGRLFIALMRIADEVSLS